MAGIKETKELVGWVCSLGNAIGSSLEDGKIGMSDLFKFIGVMNSSNSAFAGVDRVPAELTDLDEVEKAELIDFINKEFNIPQDQVEAYAKAGLVAASKLFDVYLLFKNLPKVG